MTSSKKSIINSKKSIKRPLSDNDKQTRCENRQMKHNKIAFEKQKSSNKHDPKPKGVHEDN
ncbi:8118_t:CDS:2 [Funneliformis caledonium]|uniref:8118_t:CDS:1 n=1 Tax=Funneliformis caledonium TaxID=1117310 RepID=A0A9N9I018_9GLOM|nr:8118_t:CDS:2 [Funneliformis caledonium]